MKGKQIALLMAVLVAVVLFFVLDFDRFLTVEAFKGQWDTISGFRDASPWLTAAVYFVVYVVATGLSLPGAAILTLVGGAIFGLAQGTVLVSFASSLGATLAFLLARFLFADAVRSRFRRQLEVIDRGIEKDGAFYLFALRLVPAVPFFAVNLAMSLTPLSAWRFYWVSQIGMLAGTVVYVNAGAQLVQIESLSLDGILTPGLIASFVLLGIFPLLAKKGVGWFRSRAALRRFPRPRRFDNNLIVVGAGSGGLVAALIAATVKARVTLIERHRMGGDCLNTGCVPSKSLLRSAKMLSYMRRAPEFGFRSAGAEFDFADVMERVQSIIRRIEPNDSVERYTGLGVDCVQGNATITSPWTVRVDGDEGASRELSARNIVIATGGTPFVPPIAGLAESGYYTSDTIWELRTLPGRLLVLGGGPIGCELAQAFRRLGSEVVQVEQAPHLLMREDPDVVELMRARFAEEGIRVLTGHRAERVETGEDGKRLVCTTPEGGALAVPFDALLIAVGRAPNTAGLGLEELGVNLTEQGAVEVDDYLRTNIPSIYACGDVIGPYQFTHTASHEAWYASVNALFGLFRRFRVDYSVIPWTTFTDPEVARVGLNEQEAAERGIEVEVARFDLDDLDRALADGEGYGFVKVLTPPGKDRILGATIVGHHAGDLIAEFILAMKHGIGLKKIMGTIHIYPTLAEANKFAASAWRRAHAPQGALRWVGKYHALRR